MGRPIPYPSAASVAKAGMYLSLLLVVTLLLLVVHLVAGLNFTVR